MHSSEGDLTELFLSQMRQRFPRVRLIGIVRTKAVDDIGRVVSAELDAFTVTLEDASITFDLRLATTNRAVRDVGVGQKVFWDIRLSGDDLLTVEELEEVDTRSTPR